MRDLEGVVQIRGKWIVLENIENPKLARALLNRLKDDKFAFGHSEGTGYHETVKDKRDHTERHRDNYDAVHNDNHSDYYEGYADEEHHSDTTHVDRGYSEKHDSGYYEHGDYYRKR